MSGWKFYPEGKHAARVPTPADVLGYEPGERITSFADMTRYLEALAAASERAELRDYGTSWEGRKLHLLVVSEAQNLARVDEIRARVRRLADPRALDAEEAAVIARETPAISWVAANVHGGEHSTMEACLLLAYQLAAGEDEVSRLIRKETIVVIDPLQNPDGRERSVHYYYSAFGLRPNADANAAEHGHPWPSARPNHYLFDLNRDWYPLTQRETQAKVAAFLEWRPQVYADLHEMGWDSTFYFPPPAVPVNRHLPGYTHQGWELYGRAIAATLDRHGIEYYVGERFDAFYPGYGECWPSFHGAIGMTFEQATVQGITIRRKDETTHTLRDALRHHFIAALATCETTARHREERLRAFYDFHRGAIEEGRAGDVRAYLLPAGEQSPDAAALVANLNAQGIEARRAVEAFTVADARRFPDGEPEERTFAAGSYVLPLDQPAGRLLRALFEREPELDETFVREELERKQERLPDRFYDTTAWSVPLAWGLEVYASAGGVEAGRPTTNDERPTIGAEGSRHTARSDVGRSSLVVGQTPLAYLIPYRTNAAARLLAGLLREGHRVHVAREAFRLDGVKYERGTLVVRAGANGEGLRERLEQAAVEHGIAIAAAETSWTEEGISLGSEEVVRVKPPRIAALYDVPAVVNSCGWLLYTLEERYEIPFTAVRAARLLNADLRDYDVIVFPDGWEYGRQFDDDAVKRLKAWVSAGGTLIGMRGSAAFLARPEAELTTARAVKDVRKARPAGKPVEEEAAKPAEPPKEKAEKPAAEDVPREFQTDQIPGAILRVDLSRHHFLTYGYSESACVLATTDLLFTPSEKGWNVATYAPEERLHVAGFLWEKMRKALPGQAYLIDENVGRGHVILFAEDPNFRAAWGGLTRLFLNALFFAPTLSR